MYCFTYCVYIYMYINTPNALCKTVDIDTFNARDNSLYNIWNAL